MAGSNNARVGANKKKAADQVSDSQLNRPWQFYNGCYGGTSTEMSMIFFTAGDRTKDV
jgi:hypothetical protein